MMIGPSCGAERRVLSRSSEDDVRPVTCLVVKRHLGFAVASLATAIALSSCSTVSPDAVKVGSAHISQRDFEDDLNALLKNKGFTQEFAQQFPGIEVAATSGAVTADVSRAVLNLEIRQALVHDLAAASGISGGQPVDIDSVTTTYPFLTQDIWTTLPARFQNRWGGAAVEQRLLQNQLNGPGPDDAAVNAFYEQNKDQIPGQTLEQVRPQIVQELKRQAQWNQPFLQTISDAASKTQVRVDPRYGVWDPAKGVTAIAPPTAGTDRPISDAGTATTQP
jgi:hypothetical protein